MTNKKQHIRRYKGIVFVLLVINLFVVLTSPAAFARTLKCAVNLIEPYGFLTADGQITGSHYDTMKRVVEEAGFTFEAEIAPFARVVEQLKSGQADLAMLFRNKKIEEVAEIVGPCVLTNRIVILGLAGAGYKSLEDLHGKVVAHLQGAHYDDALAADETINKYFTVSYQQNIELFRRKRVDAIVGPELGLLYASKKYGLALDMFGEPLLLNHTINYLFFSKKTMDEETLLGLRKTLDRLREEGVIDEFRNKYIRLLYSQ